MSILVFLFYWLPDPIEHPYRPYHQIVCYVLWVFVVLIQLKTFIIIQSKKNLIIYLSISDLIAKFNYSEKLFWIWFHAAHRKNIENWFDVHKLKIGNKLKSNEKILIEIESTKRVKNAANLELMELENIVANTVYLKAREGI